MQYDVPVNSTTNLLQIYWTPTAQHRTDNY